MNHSEGLFFSIFIVIISGILLFDLGLFEKNSHKVGFREAMLFTCFWIVLSVGFFFFLRYKAEIIHLGKDVSIEKLQFLIDKYKHPIDISGLNLEQAVKVYEKNLSLEYLTGYLIEKALSVDNIFVMVMIFYAFGVDPKYYKRVLFWGILGAIVLRFIFIFAASALIQKFSWILILFGVLLVYTGIHMFLTRNKKEKIDVSKHPVVRLVSKYFPVFPRFLRHHFFVRAHGKLYVTPLFIVLLVIEFTDVIFATDSIPAIFAITRDPYIVFFSNVFAILGLRAMFFLLVNVIDTFRYLKTGLSFMMLFIGLKMIFHTWLKSIGFQTEHSLYFILLILTVSIGASLLYPERQKSV